MSAYGAYKCEEAGSFYFNPRHDVLWFSFDFTDESDYLRDLLRCYGEQLNDIESVLIEEAEWEGLTPARYKSKYLSRLRGLKSITVLFRDDDDDDDDNDSVQDVDEENDGGEIANDEDNRELINRHDCSKELDTEVTNLQARADELKREYAKLSKNQDGIAKDFRCIDRCAAQLFGSKNDDPGSDDPQQVDSGITGHRSQRSLIRMTDDL
ncbi:hypothetical protein BKA61DRAFT_688507 [Leptodontidium sp. MPI-SDFR-AT-0119]|nr:hypothetical protein BKA61DRAFT_688507 [Leptodontidium sp. MPI-SDFR-AT-0119]